MRRVVYALLFQSESHLLAIQRVRMVIKLHDSISTTSQAVTSGSKNWEAITSTSNYLETSMSTREYIKGCNQFTTDMRASVLHYLSRQLRLAEKYSVKAVNEAICSSTKRYTQHAMANSQSIDAEEGNQLYKQLWLSFYFKVFGTSEP